MKNWKLRARGSTTSSSDFSPFPTEALAPYINGAKKVLIVEEDLTAQLHELFAINFACHDKLLSLLQYDGTPFLASTIVKKAEEVY